MLIIGIDPGISGAICFFEEGQVKEIIDMPLSMYFVRPAKWKKYFGLIKTEKDASRTKVIEIFPYISSQLSRKKDSNKADAVLIASFFYNTYKKAD